MEHFSAVDLSQLPLQQHDGGNRACGEEAEGRLDFQTTTMKKKGAVEEEMEEE